MSIDFQNLFQSAPDLYLLLSPDLTIEGASDAYLKATLTKREIITSRNLFEVFPDDPNDSSADGVSNLQASLNLVKQHKAAHAMAVQRYAIPRPDGSFEERFWQVLNTPVSDATGEIVYIIHRVEDITELEQLKRKTANDSRRRKEPEAAEEQHLQHIKQQEDLFSKIFDLSPVAIYITNFEDGKFEHVNKAFEQLFQFKSEEVIGKTAVELKITNESKRAAMVKEIDARGGRMADTEMDLTTADGTVKNLLATSEVIEIHGRKSFLVAMVDITQRKVTEDELRQTNHFLDTILENLPDMVFVKDAADFKFLRINAAGEKILGLQRGEMLGKNDYDFFPAEQAAFFTAKDREVMEHNKLVEIDEEPINTKFGERWLHTKKIPVIENGNPLYLIGISNDITEKKKQQDAILQLNKELEAFTYSVSHDLRSPLRAISGYSRMLEEDYSNILDSEGKRLLGIIEQNAIKMGQLIDNLLAFSRIGRKGVAASETDMNMLVNETIAELNKIIPHHTEIKVHNLHQIKSDHGLMYHVLMNLISNAIKYSSRKEKPVVEIRSQATGNEVVFSVKDNGAGFDMRYANKLFGVFQRLHGSDEFDGTGVGLAIVQRIVSKHGGRVWAEGKVDEGATFYFSIPLQNDDKINHTL